MGRYLADGIDVLPALEAVRRRPHFFLGDLTDTADPEVLNCLVVETLCLAADALASGVASRVELTLQTGGEVTVEDDGPGLAIEPYNGQISHAERIVSTLSACRLVKVHAGVGDEYCKNGIVVTNALSEFFNLDVARGGEAWSLRYERGVQTLPLTRVGPTENHGTRVRFRPDPAIFGPREIDAARLLVRLGALGLRGLAFVDARQRRTEGAP